jgi:hypothetical protein
LNSELNRPSITIGLAFCAGIGLTLMVIALGIGAVQGDAANLPTVNVTFAAGLVMLIAGIIGWFAVVQPQRHFDNINVPAEDDHHSGDAEEHAIVATNPDDPALAEYKH